MKYFPIIGLEVHVELSTKSKMFCGCPRDHFGKPPNTQTCPVCLGLPGALPVPNEKAVEWTILIALALNCSINRMSKFDRKHYFYPDLPKGYQISQYDEPLGLNGYLETSEGGVRIRRVHLEEDTGKLQHTTLNGEKVTLVDFNRSGVPLVEIVSEPDMHSATQAKEFAQKLQTILRSLKVSDCDMERGSMRLEANISLADYGVYKSNNRLPEYKVEVKNINSFRFLEKAIEFEVQRQTKLLSAGKKPSQETRGWDETKRATVAQRFKETEADYRYFPEPDIPPMVFSERFISSLKRKLPKLPDEVVEELIDTYQLREDYARLISTSPKLLKYCLSAFRLARSRKLDFEEIASLVINYKVDIQKVSPEELVEKMVSEKKEKITDLQQIKSWVRLALSEDPKAVQDYKKGKTQAISVLIGSVMRYSSGKADPQVVRSLIEKMLKNY